MAIIKRPRVLGRRVVSDDIDYKKLEESTRRGEEKAAKAYEMQRAISQGRYDFTSVRTFTPEEIRTLDDQTRIAVSNIIYGEDDFGRTDHSMLLGLTSDQVNSKRARIEKITKGYEGGAVKEGVISGTVRILEHFSTSRSIPTDDIKELLTQFGIPLRDVELNAQLLRLIDRLLHSNEISVIKEIVAGLDVDREGIGELILGQVQRYSGRKDFYDPVKIAEQLEVPNEIRDRISAEYSKQLRMAGNDAASVIVDKEDGVEEIGEWGAKGLDVLKKLLREENYPDAIALAERLELGDELVQAVKALQKYL